MEDDMDNVKAKIIELRTVPLGKNYSVDEAGNVYSNKRPHIPGGNLKIWLNSHGYPSVRIYLKGKPKIVMIHRLIAENFIPNPKGLPQINHKDGNKKNFATGNLEWVTDSENKQHAYDTGLRKHSSNTNRKYIYSDNGKYRVIISRQGGQKIRLPRFQYLQDAIEARDKALNIY